MREHPSLPPTGASGTAKNGNRGNRAPRLAEKAPPWGHCWEYEMGEWRVVSDPFAGELGDDFEQAIREAGYSSISRTLFDDGRTIADLYEVSSQTAHTKKWKYVISVSLCGICTEICVVDFPSLLRLMNELQPLLTALHAHQDEDDSEDSPNGKVARR